MPKRYVSPVSSNQRKKRPTNDNGMSGAGSTEIEKCTFGSLHQGSDVFLEGSRGRQCVSNALVSILYKYINVREVREWNPQDIDFILRRGDELYQHIRQYCTHSYLHPNDLPSYFCFEKSLLRCSVGLTFSGNLCDSFVENGPFLSLESAMASCFYGSTQSGIFFMQRRGCVYFVFRSVLSCV